MASDGDIRIDLRGDGRVILYKRDNLKDPVWQARVRVPNSTGYKRITTKTSDQREAERFALNYYEELYIHVKTGGSIKSKTFKQVFAEWEKHVATMGHTRKGGSWEADRRNIHNLRSTGKRVRVSRRTTSIPIQVGRRLVRNAGTRISHRNLDGKCNNRPNHVYSSDDYEFSWLLDHIHRS